MRSSLQASTYYFILTTDYILLTTYCLLLATHYSLLTSYYLLLTTHLDAFITTASGGSRNQLYRGSDGGQFRLVATGPVVEAMASSTAAAWGDCDADGSPDL